MSTVRAEDVLARMSPESRARIAELSENLIAEYEIFLDLKAADDLTRETPEYKAKFASLPSECRAELLRLEAEKLRRYVGAMGGKLRASAEFPDGSKVVLDE